VSGDDWSHPCEIVRKYGADEVGDGVGEELLGLVELDDVVVRAAQWVGGAGC